MVSKLGSPKKSISLSQLMIETLLQHVVEDSENFCFRVPQIIKEIAKGHLARQTFREV